MLTFDVYIYHMFIYFVLKNSEIKLDHVLGKRGYDDLLFTITLKRKNVDNSFYPI